MMIRRPCLAQFFFLHRQVYFCQDGVMNGLFINRTSSSLEGLLVSPLHIKAEAPPADEDETEKPEEWLGLRQTLEARVADVKIAAAQAVEFVKVLTGGQCGQLFAANSLKEGRLTSRLACTRSPAGIAVNASGMIVAPRSE